MMKAKVNFKVGDGQKVSFWNDNWIGQAPLKQEYLYVFSLYLQQLLKCGLGKAGTYISEDT